MGAIIFMCISYALVSFIIIAKSNFFAKMLVKLRKVSDDQSEELIRKYEVSISTIGYIFLALSLMILVCFLLFNYFVF